MDVNMNLLYTIRCHWPSSTYM